MFCKRGHVHEGLVKSDSPSKVSVGKNVAPRAAVDLEAMLQRRCNTFVENNFHLDTPTAEVVGLLLHHLAVDIATRCVGQSGGWLPSYAKLCTVLPALFKRLANGSDVRPTSVDSHIARRHISVAYAARSRRGLLKKQCRFGSSLG